MFRFSVYEEESVGVLVGVVSANDIDSGTFGQVQYTLDGPGANSFIINGSTGEIRTVVTLDRESRPESFDLVASATDQDQNSVDRNIGRAQVIITSKSHDSIVLYYYCILYSSGS